MSPILALRLLAVAMLALAALALHPLAAARADEPVHLACRPRAEVLAVITAALGVPDPIGPAQARLALAALGRGWPVPGPATEAILVHWPGGAGALLMGEAGYLCAIAHADAGRWPRIVARVFGEAS